MVGILIWQRVKASTQSKIADLQFAVSIDQKISGFEISVNDRCGMDVLHA